MRSEKETMARYIIFLRGINVSGQRKIKMADLRASLEKSEFKNVLTYIQSGNIIVEADKTVKQALASKISTIILHDFGFEVPTLVFLVEEIEAILMDVPFQNIEKKNLYFTLLFKKPNQESVDAFNKTQFENEDFYIREQCVYLNCKKGAGKAKLNNNLIEKRLGVIATTRNLNTLKKMLELG